MRQSDRRLELLQYRICATSLVISAEFSDVSWPCWLAGRVVGPVIVFFFLVTAVGGLLLFALLLGFIVLGYVEVVAPNGRLHKPATYFASDKKKHSVNGGHGQRVELVWR